jgi:hypothetical protein
MTTGNVVASTQSWGPFVDCCISAWFPWMTDPLGAQAVRQLGILSRCRGEDVLGKFSRYVSNFNCFFTLTCEFNSLLHAVTFLFGRRS